MSCLCDVVLRQRKAIKINLSTYATSIAGFGGYCFGPHDYPSEGVYDSFRSSRDEMPLPLLKECRCSGDTLTLGFE